MTSRTPQSILLSAYLENLNLTCVTPCQQYVFFKSIAHIDTIFRNPQLPLDNTVTVQLLQ